MLCNGFICPAAAFKCVFTSVAIIDNNQKVKTKTECLGKSEETLRQKESTVNNPDPESETSYSQLITIHRDGTVRISDSSGQKFVKIPNRRFTVQEKEELRATGVNINYY